MTTNIAESQVTKYSSDDVVLSVQGVSKKFCRSLKRSLFYGMQDIGSELVGARKDNNQLRKEEFWALKDVSFELKKGESLGLVGANGSGKTTLLRIISGLIKPDTGSVKITGRVAPLIALGAGFNPILTGRENIYVNMSILGLSKEEIDEKFDEVVDFAEIGDAIDAPVQTYSSGMAARLGFACAIHTEPDILLIDEVLAVGDVSFRGKCFRKLATVKKKGTTFILVSHNFHQLFQSCDLSLYLSHGKLITKGYSKSVINQYEQDSLIRYSSNHLDKENKSEITFFTRDKNLELEIISVEFKDNNNNKIESPHTGKAINLSIKCNIYSKSIDNINLTLVNRNISQDNILVFIMSNSIDGEILKISNTKYELMVEMPYLCLIPSRYNMRIQIRQGDMYILDEVDFKFTVVSSINVVHSILYQPRNWQSFPIEKNNQVSN